MLVFRLSLADIQPADALQVTKFSPILDCEYKNGVTLRFFYQPRSRLIKHNRFISIGQHTIVNMPSYRSRQNNALQISAFL